MVGSNGLRKYAWSRVSRIGTLFGLVALLGLTGAFCFPQIPLPCDDPDFPGCAEGLECFNIDGEAVCLIPCDEETPCDDDNLCTTDVCHEDGYCEFTPLECEVEGEVCDPATGECITPCLGDEDCDDGDLCTDDSCDTETGLCLYEDVDCGDNICDPATGECVECLADGDCDDALFCNGAETCVEGLCLAGVDPCEEGLLCDEETDTCVECLTDDDCAEGEICDAGVCRIVCEFDEDCDDDDLCTTDTCDVETGLCSNEPVDCGEQLCDPATGECVDCLIDEDCAEGETCVDGVCEGEIPCTGDEDCDNGLYCDGLETCNLETGLCEDGERPCNDAEKVGEENATETCEEGDNEAVCIPIPTDCYLFTLGSDTLNGTAGEDCFRAELEFSPGAGAQVSHLQTGDSANGLAGPDTLDAKLNGTNASPTLTGIETLNFSVFDANTTINCTNVSGVDTINTVNSTNVLTLTSIQENVDFGLINSSAAAVGTNIMAPTFVSSVTSGASDSFTLTFDGVTVGMFTVTTQGTSGFESIDVVSSGASDNILDTFDHAGNTTLLTANFSGAANLQIKNLDPTILTVDASAMTGNLTLGDGNNTTDGYTEFAANAMNNITGGEGDDFIIMDNAFTTADFNGATEQIDGGAGTDSLQAQLSSVIGTVFPIANVEDLYLYANTSASSINLTGVTGLETVTIDHEAGAQVLTLLNIGGSPLPALIYRGDGKQTAQNYDEIHYTASGVGGSDNSLDITVGNRGMALNASGVTNVHTLGAIEVPGVEILTLTVTDGPATITTGITATTATSLTFTASSNLTVPAIVATAATDTITAIDASAVTGNFVCATGTATWGNGLSVTLGSGNDQFTLGNNGVAADTTIITLGAGNDIFTSTDTVAADVINGGDGTDIITGGGGDDTISGGTGVDSFVLDYSLAGVDVDVISDFATGAAGDQIDLDVSALQTAGTSGINALATQFTDLQAGTDQTDATPVAIQEITADAAAVAGTNVYVIVGTTAATPAALATLIEVGTHEITGAHANVAVQDSFIVVYTDGTDAFVAACQVAVDSGGDFVAGDLTAVNLAQISGVTAITAGLFNNANFDFIP